MAKERFTGPKVERFKCRPGKAQDFMWDVSTAGLGLRVTPAGKPAYIFQGRFQDKTLRHMNTNRCLSTQQTDPNVPKLVECDPNSSYQQWIMSSKFKWQAA